MTGNKHVVYLNEFHICTLMLVKQYHLQINNITQTLI